MMLENKPCPQCETMRDVELVTREEKVTMKGCEISFSAQSYQCQVCKEEFDTAETLDNNLNAARETYDRQHKMLTTEELVALRKKYNASQKAFSLLLGFGELTINSYEQGAEPNSSNRLLLKLAASPHIFREIYSENKHKIGAIQRKRIEASDGFTEHTVTPGCEQKDKKTSFWANNFFVAPAVVATGIFQIEPQYRTVDSGQQQATAEWRLKAVCG